MQKSFCKKVFIFSRVSNEISSEKIAPLGISKCLGVYFGFLLCNRQLLAFTSVSNKSKYIEKEISMHMCRREKREEDAKTNYLCK